MINLFPSFHAFASNSGAFVADFTCSVGTARSGRAGSRWGPAWRRATTTASPTPPTSPMGKLPPAARSASKSCGPNRPLPKWRAGPRGAEASPLGGPSRGAEGGRDSRTRSAFNTFEFARKGPVRGCNNAIYIYIYIGALAGAWL